MMIPSELLIFINNSNHHCVFILDAELGFKLKDLQNRPTESRAHLEAEYFSHLWGGGAEVTYH